MRFDRKPSLARCVFSPASSFHPCICTHSWKLAAPERRCHQNNFSLVHPRYMGLREAGWRCQAHRYPTDALHDLYPRQTANNDRYSYRYIAYTNQKCLVQLQTGEPRSGVTIGTTSYAGSCTLINPYWQGFKQIA